MVMMNNYENTINAYPLP